MHDDGPCIHFRKLAIDQINILKTVLKNFTKCCSLQNFTKCCSLQNFNCTQRKNNITLNFKSMAALLEYFTTQ